MSDNYITINEQQYKYPSQSNKINELLKTNSDGSKNNKTIHSIIIPKCISSISDYRFKYLYDLNYLDMSNSDISSIPMYMCIKCENLNTIKLPSSLMYINIGAFRDCKSLRDIKIPKMVNTISSECFENCENLIFVTFEDNSELRTISNHAFNNCKSISEFIIPRNVYDIGMEAFANCNSLKAIGMSYFTYDKAVGPFMKCINETSYDLKYDLSYFGLKGEWEILHINSFTSTNNVNNREYIIGRFKHCDIVLINKSIYSRNYDSYKL